MKAANELTATLSALSLSLPSWDQFADEGADESADDQSGRRKEYHADDQPYERASGRLLRAAEPTRQPSRQQVVEHRDRERREPPRSSGNGCRTPPLRSSASAAMRRSSAEGRAEPAEYSPLCRPERTVRPVRSARRSWFRGFMPAGFPAARSGVRSMNRIPSKWSISCWNTTAVNPDTLSRRRFPLCPSR